MVFKRSFSRGRRRKVPVRWMQDTEMEGLQTIASSTGLITTTFIPFTTTVTQRPDDPAERMNQLGLSTDLYVRDQLLQDPGWRLMRAVGEFVVGVKQVVTGPEAAPAAPFVKVKAGLCLMEVDENGSPDNDEQWQLGQVLPTPNAIDVANQLEGESNSWIWRRTWILQNFMSGVTAVPAGRFELGDVTGAGQDLSANTAQPFHLGFSSNVNYQSVHLGAHFDIKRHVTVKKNESLFWAIWARALGDITTAPPYISLAFNISKRALIARPGRAYRQR